jgi:hypothetical protein
MEMYIVITEIPGRRPTIQNTIPLLRHNHLLQKVRILIPGHPEAQHLPVKCPALPATGRGVVPVQVPGVVVECQEAAEAVVVGVVVVVVLEEEEEDDLINTTNLINEYQEFIFRS